jgi:hypothetical protein
MPAHIIPIVEGHGEVEAVPILIRRIAHSLGIFDTKVGKPIRCPRDKVVKEGELERALELAAKKVQGSGQILVLIDAGPDCPAELGPRLEARARRARGDIPSAVVLAKKEFEAWFLASLGSLKPDATPPADVENIQGAKERLSSLIGLPYSETADQPAFTAQFDMNSARVNSPSFDKCWRAVESLLEAEYGR